MPLDLNLRIQAFTEDYLQSPKLKLDSRGQRDLTALLEDLGYRQGGLMDGTLHPSNEMDYTRKKGDSIEALLMGREIIISVTGREEVQNDIAYLLLEEKEGGQVRDDYHAMGSLSLQLDKHKGFAGFYQKDKVHGATVGGILGFGSGLAGFRGLTYGFVSTHPALLGLMGLGVLVMGTIGILGGYFIGGKSSRKHERICTEISTELEQIRNRFKRYKLEVAYDGAEALKRALTLPSS